MLDAPVSGGTGGATAGALTFMVGGSLADFDRAQGRQRTTTNWDSAQLTASGLAAHYAI
ncbi:3-hydroxyisobutyrate dehydrogenase [compost metagenome]